MLAAESIKAVRIFCSYAHKNRIFRNHLERHLEALKRSGQVVVWHDREILPVGPWQHEIDENLDAADIILLLVSDYFFASDYCWGVEMHRALERHKLGEAHVIPILLSPVDCDDTPVSKLQMLPAGRRPITKWPNRDEAYLDVVKGIREIVKALQARQWERQGEIYFSSKYFDKALEAYKEAILLDPDNYYLHKRKGDCLFSVGLFEEAIAAYDKSIHLKPDYGPAWKGQGDAFNAFAPLASGKYERLAEQSYQQADALETAKIREQKGVQS